MRAPARIGLYLAGLGVVFAVSAATADAIVPEETVAAWTQSTQGHGEKANGEEIPGAGSTDTDSGSDERGH
ncbi:hypothetical protein MF406_09925 [Georgenia sp. TF02-10]|uniref:hypothetical protein n=1 Tax=Georgenia sp. TF02-10 TaxID=2917725 RepID=UPI001FA758C7|nr:hypothetical protein [Georgenia sp. TF02-10]UNX53337.1 hypothetical protein MF406_09925 [Georgenia sp. TF02-10]